MNRGDVVNSLAGSLSGVSAEIEDQISETNFLLREIIGLLGGDKEIFFKKPSLKRFEMDCKRRETIERCKLRKALPGKEENK